MNIVTYTIRHKQFSTEDLKLLGEFTNELKDCYKGSKLYLMLSSEIVMIYKKVVSSLTSGITSTFSIREGKGSFTLNTLLMFMKIFYPNDFEILETSLIEYELEQWHMSLNDTLMQFNIRRTSDLVRDYIQPIMDAEWEEKNHII